MAAAAKLGRATMPSRLADGAGHRPGLAVRNRLVVVCPQRRPDVRFSPLADSSARLRALDKPTFLPQKPPRAIGLRRSDILDKTRPASLTAQQITRSLDVSAF